MSNPPLVSRRRIEGLKQLAADCGLTADDARLFGKLSKTSTWEALLDSHKLEYERANSTLHNDILPVADRADYINDGVNPVCDYGTRPSINFFEWVDFSQLVALALATVGLFMLVASLLPAINPFNLCPVKFNLTIQSGVKK
ncbi:MAG TPA: hypothetical protein DCS91_12805 [Microcoleaceae bacterium UBA11344]|nr:hypothetical protein [Microcoleaceae cyanobacterium UBA11344]